LILNINPIDSLLSFGMIALLENVKQTWNDRYIDSNLIEIVANIDSLNLYFYNTPDEFCVRHFTPPCPKSVGLFMIQ